MRLQGLFTGSYPHFAQASIGGASFPPLNAAAETAGQVNPNERAQFGDALVDKFGNVYCYVRFAQASVLGDVLRRSVPGVGDHPAAGTISANTTARVVISNITTTVDEAAIGSFILSSPPATTPFLKRVKAVSGGSGAFGTNTTFTVSKLQVFHGIGKYDGDEISAVPTTGDTIVIVRPYNVAVGAAASAGLSIPVGVSLGTVAAGSAALIQVQGLASVKVDATAALVAGAPLTTGASGNAVALTGTPTAFEVAQIVGTCAAASASGTGKSGVFVSCIHRL